LSVAEHRLSFTTSLPPEECRRRLKSRCAGWRDAFRSSFTMEVDPARPLLGRVTERGFWLFLRIRYRNSFQTRASGRFRAESGETRVDVRFGMTMATRAFMAVWFAGVGLGAIGALLARLGGRAEPGLEGAWILIPFAMFAFGIGLVTFGRWLARDEERRLREILTRELDAREGVQAWTPIE
jgi:hypothetical protein